MDLAWSYAGGRSIVLDATFGQVAERDAIRALAERTGSRLVWLACRADEATTARGWPRGPATPPSSLMRASNHGPRSEMPFNGRATM